MSALQLMPLGGVVIAIGILILARSLRPAPPALLSSLHELAVKPHMTVVPVSAGLPSTRYVPAALRKKLESRLRITDADLKLINKTRADVAAQKITFAVVAFLTSELVGGFVVLLFPVFRTYLASAITAISLLSAYLSWKLPTDIAKDDAADARREFRACVATFLLLVAGERRARGSINQALASAASVSDAPAFIHLRRAITQATEENVPPWDYLRALGVELDIPELRNVSDIASAAADGASVYHTILATARTARHAELAAQRTLANQNSERMSMPLSVMVSTLTLFVLIPLLLHLFM